MKKKPAWLNLGHLFWGGGYQVVVLLVVIGMIIAHDYRPLVESLLTNGRKGFVHVSNGHCQKLNANRFEGNQTKNANVVSNFEGFPI